VGDAAGQVVVTVVRRLPAAVAAEHAAAPGALHRNDADENGTPRVDLGANLHDLARGAADERLEFHLCHAGALHGGVAPVAEGRRAVAREVDAPYRNHFHRVGEGRVEGLIGKTSLEHVEPAGAIIRLHRGAGQAGRRASPYLQELPGRTERQL
jgi:hypothetical protein